MARLLKLSLPRTPAEWIYRRDGALARFEEGTRLAIRWKKEIPTDGKRIKPIYNELVRAKRSSPAGAGGLPDKKFNQLVAQASLDGDVAKLNELFSTNPGKEIAETTAGHPLVLASTFGHERAVRALLDHGADVNYQDRAGITALMRAVTRKKSSIVKVLLAAGADRTLKSKDGESAVDMARDRGDTETQKLLEN